MAVNLNKGQRISLVKKGGASLSKVRMGLGWDAVKKRGIFGRKAQEIDLDASCLVFAADGTRTDQVWFKQLKSSNGAIVHTGDNLTGAGEGDDESILVDLRALPSDAHTLVFVVNSYSGQDFSQIENAYCRLIDTTNGEEVARFDLSGSGRHTAQVMAKVSRDGVGWSMTAIGQIADGRTFKDLEPIARRHV